MSATLLSSRSERTQCDDAAAAQHTTVSANERTANVIVVLLHGLGQDWDTETQYIKNAIQMVFRLQSKEPHGLLRIKNRQADERDSIGRYCMGVGRPLNNL